MSKQGFGLNTSPCESSFLYIEIVAHYKAENQRLYKVRIKLYNYTIYVSLFSLD
jgi:hypothetical protein